MPHFPARVLDWVNQLRGGAARTTDLYQLAVHNQLGYRDGRDLGRGGFPLIHYRQTCTDRIGEALQLGRAARRRNLLPDNRLTGTLNAYQFAVWSPSRRKNGTLAGRYQQTCVRPDPPPNAVPIR